MSFYWITRLDALHTAMSVMATIAGTAFCVLVILAIVYYGHTTYDSYEDEKRQIKTFKMSSIACGILFLASLTGAILVPTTKEMCAIYCVEYLQTNPDAKQLPDKMIKAANAYFDELAKIEIEKDTIK